MYALPSEEALNRVLTAKLSHELPLWESFSSEY